MTRNINVGKISFGGKKPFVLIAGPCVIESQNKAVKLAKSIKEICEKNKVPLIFKASYDKANRTSIKSYRGPGLKAGLEILKEIKEELNLPILSDVHSPSEAEYSAQVLDIIQIPAFLCRQTDLLVAAGKTKRVINIKKGQFLDPLGMKYAIDKVCHGGNRQILLTERGTTFGYQRLVADMTSLAAMGTLGYPVIFDATHSVQQPGGLGEASGGNSQYVPLLARAALAAGCDGIFLEVHDNPKKALSDGPNMLPLKDLDRLLKQLKMIDAVRLKG